MNRILVPSAGPDSWRQFLAKPDLHWATGYSARTMAQAWEAARGFPPEISAILDAALGPTELLLAIPEHKTPLPGGKRESQSDVFALGRYKRGLVACTVEGKVDEPFGPTIGEWLREPSPGKETRLAHILNILGLRDCPPDVHYQLLHRSASAVIEAERFCARNAAMIVQSFSPERRWFEEFERFVDLFDVNLVSDGPVIVTLSEDRELVLGWAQGNQKFQES